MKLQKARKDHVCGCCGKKIPKGDKYWNNYHDDSRFADKTHGNCEDYSERLTAQQSETP